LDSILKFNSFLTYLLKQDKMIEKIIGSSILTSKQASQLMNKYGSPLYVYDANILRRKACML